MTDKAREEMSALMDGEASEFEVHHVLKCSENDDDLKATWGRYHTLRSVLRGEMREKGASDTMSMDISAAVAQAIAEEPVYEGAATTNTVKVPLIDRVLRPLGSVAVAASVSAMVIFGWQSTGGFSPQQGLADGSVAQQTPVVQSSDRSVATNTTQSYTVSRVPNYSNAGSSSNGYILADDSGQSASRSGMIESQDIIRLSLPQDERFNRYILSHSGNAALNTLSGVMPYARVVTLKPSAANAK
ncbi:hypothetical protein A9Q99_21765 [Gammaproteobacteria bacterium 45_16_T64]|nr:hypothetical protein A9Q99_21765 [Gammaproteobacteria bacterium 45_16_T64]